ncbi:4-coumarate--CoA ligase [Solimonas sp. K1W22B-7]|uniref:AMP-binding protein n=1 Tax=Solimonas sp. K1W22B-7 TaxID=2303331 RepID=UPI000E33479C|nr:AMP-binding protein [Solimonas sp. K1W22B-7]AXQ29299.1 4-coumarate--CoA ligase [Solimonas sp. K1W22B-7]
MSEFIALGELMSRGRPAALPVAFDAGRDLCFGEFRAAVSGWQSAFRRQPGKRWALYSGDAYACASALFGAWHAGKTVVLPGDAQPETLARLAHEVDGFAGNLPQALVPDRDAPDMPFASLGGDEPVLQLYTSGSSGEPVAIGKQLRQLDAELLTLQSCWGPSLVDTRIHASVSHQHIYGLLFGLLWPLAAGRAFAVQRLAFPEEMAQVLAERPCAVVSSPAHLKRLPQSLDWTGAQKQLRMVFSSGGPLPEAAVSLVRELLGHAPLEIYGSSETGGIAWRQRHTAEAGWRALPGVELRIEPAAPLALRSAHLPDADWFQGSDRARWLADGSFLLEGRSDRIVKLEEKRLSLDAMERQLLAGGLLDELRLLVLDEARATLAGVAVPSAAGQHLLQQDGKTALNQALRQQLSALVEPMALPRRWRYVAALPVNSQGKTTQAQLAALFDPRRPCVKLQHHDAASASLALRFDADSPYFEGHFPVAPILPGVAQVEWAIRLGRELFDLPADFLRMEALKFQQVIRPGADILLDLQWQAGKATLGFRLHSPAGTHAGGRIVFAAP